MCLCSCVYMYIMSIYTVYINTHTHTHSLIHTHTHLHKYLHTYNIYVTQSSLTSQTPHICGHAYISGHFIGPNVVLISLMAVC